MVASISSALGIGSGLDIKAMVDGLSAAAKAPKEAQIVRREETNAARLSTLAEVGGAIDFFASALSSLIAGGSLFSQPTVSDPSVFTATALAGSRLGGLSGSMEVLQLAQAQTLQSAPLAGRLAPVGQGELVLATAAGTFTVTIDETNDSLEGLARAINDKRAGVTATIVTEAGNARLVVRGATGEAQAFTLSVEDGTDSGLERFAFGGGASSGLSLAQAAQDAIVRLDGVQVRRASNGFSDLVPGVQIDLKRAAPGSTVAIGLARPTAAIEQGVRDFVEAYNELAAMIAQATAPGFGGGVAGPLRGDLGIREMQRQLSQLTSTMLSSDSSGPRTLAEIGVRTNRDGTLSVNSSQLKAMLEKNPDGVEALFNPAQHSSSPLVTIRSAVDRVKPGTYQLTDLVPAADGQGATGKIDGRPALSSGSSIIAPAGHPAVGLILRIEGAVANATVTIDQGLGGALKSIRDALRGRGGPFEGAQGRLAKEARQIAKDREQLELRSEAYHGQLLSTFSAMERQVSAFKATQSYLDQQIKIWTASRN